MKKGVGTLLLAIAGLIGGISVLLLSTTFAQPVNSEYIGENQLVILETAQEAENFLLYLDYSAKFAFQKSYNEYIANLTTECGSFLGYSLFNNQDKDCFPTNPKISMIKNVKKNLPLYLEKYPMGKPPNYYIDFLTQDDEYYMVAYADDDLRISLGQAVHVQKYLGETKNKLTGAATVTVEDTSKRDIAGIYEITPNTKVKIFDFPDYFSTLQKQVQIMISDCSGNSNSDNCIQEKMSYFKFTPGCDITEKDVYYEIVHNYELIQDSSDDDCVYSFDLPHTYLKFDDKRISIEVLDANTKTRFKFQNEALDVETKKLKKVKAFNIDIDYKTKRVDKIIADGVNMGSSFKIYKKDNKLIFLPKDEYLKFKTSRYSKKCKVKKDKYKMCAKDELKNKYKFAITLADIAPPKIRDVKAFATPDVKKSITIEFSPSQVADLHHYVVYYYPIDFNVDDVKFDKVSNRHSNILKKEFQTGELIEVGDKVQYLLTDRIEENKQYNLVVSAIDDAGQQIEDLSSLDVVKPSLI